MKLYYVYTLKALWDGQGKSKMYYGMSSVKKKLSGKRSIQTLMLKSVILKMILLPKDAMSAT